jgi:acyl-CoA reductase-like NAD-dependent aldehyde dehydrogenase
MAANKMRVPLAKMAVEETGMGVVEDKVIKNNYAAEYIYNAYKNTKTCGVIEEDKAYGIKKIAEPIGLIAAVIPTTNPTSTVIFKTLISLKTRNGIIISPHPRAKNATIAAGIKYSFWLMLKAKNRKDLNGQITNIVNILNRGVRDNFVEHKLVFSSGISVFPYNSSNSKRLLEQAITALEMNQCNKESPYDFFTE